MLVMFVEPPKRTIPPPHETHSQLASGQRIYTPAELSKLKAERDARHYAEMVKRRQEIYQQAVAAGRPVVSLRFVSGDAATYGLSSLECLPV